MSIEDWRRQPEFLSNSYELHKIFHAGHVSGYSIAHCRKVWLPKVDRATGQPSRGATIPMYQPLMEGAYIYIRYTVSACAALLYSAVDLFEFYRVLFKNYFSHLGGRKKWGDAFNL